MRKGCSGLLLQTLNAFHSLRDVADSICKVKHWKVSAVSTGDSFHLSGSSLLPCLSTEAVGIFIENVKALPKKPCKVRSPQVNNYK